MAQTPISLLAVENNAAGWGAALEGNIDKINDYFKTLDIEVTVDGNTGLASEVTITLQNGAATPTDVNQQFVLAVRLVDDDGADAPEWDNATNATISAITTGTELEDVSSGADKYMYIKSDANGVIVVELTDATAEKFWLVVGPSPIQPIVCNYNNNVQLDHT